MDLYLEKIISGGQTGADLAGLEAAQILGFKTGGIAPPGYITNKGSDYSLKTKYNLDELKSSKNISICYGIRSKANVDNSDGTIAFRTHYSPGTDKTIGYCLTGSWCCIKPDKWSNYTNPHRPVLVVSFEKNDTDKVKKFLSEHKIKTLNICGHRDTTNNNEWTKKVKNFLLNSLK